MAAATFTVVGAAVTVVLTGATMTVVVTWDVIDPALNPDLVDIRKSYTAGRTVVARLDEVIAAMGTVISRDPGVAEIVRMSVRKAVRRSGVGSLIVSELVLTARAWGASKSCWKRRFIGIASWRFTRPMGSRSPTIRVARTVRTPGWNWN